MTEEQTKKYISLLIHSTISHLMLTTYKELYSHVQDNFGGQDLSRFFPMQGNKYNEELKLFLDSVWEKCYHSIQEEKSETEVRLMVVGRSVNGWEKLETTVEEFGIAAEKFIGKDGFKWLRDDGTGVDTYIREPDKKECRYNINKSSFFRCTRKILAELKPVTVSEPRWFEHIVWSNLYCIAPLHSGNAEGKLQEVQLEKSKELLLQQIEFFKPTHMVFITDWEWWFEKFQDILPNVIKTGDSKVDNVVGKGFFKNTKIVVTVRPDRTRPNRPDENIFVEDVINAYNEI